MYRRRQYRIVMPGNLVTRAKKSESSSDRRNNNNAVAGGGGGVTREETDTDAERVCASTPATRAHGFYCL